MAEPTAPRRPPAYPQIASPSRSQRVTVPTTCLEHRGTGVASGVQRSLRDSPKTAPLQGKRWLAVRAAHPPGQLPKLNTGVRFPVPAPREGLVFRAFRPDPLDRHQAPCLQQRRTVGTHGEQQALRQHPEGLVWPLPGAPLAPRQTGPGRHDLRHQSRCSGMAGNDGNRSGVRPARRPVERPSAVRAWHGRLSKPGLHPNTVAKVYRLFRTMLDTAVDDGLLRTNPVHIKGAAVERSIERPALDWDDIEPIADAIHPRFRALVWVEATSGLRGPIGSQTAHWFQPRLESAVVPLDPVVRVLLGVVGCFWDQFIDNAQQGCSQIGGDLDRVARGRPTPFRRNAWRQRCWVVSTHRRR